MSRLIDRILQKLEPFNPTISVPEGAEMPDYIRTHYHSIFRKHLSHEEEKSWLETIRKYIEEDKPVLAKQFDTSRLIGVPVFAADNVGRYHARFMKYAHLSDIVASMAPPFEKFFVEFQRVPNSPNAHAWGLFFTAREDPDQAVPFTDWVEFSNDDDRKPRWVLEAYVFAEKRKGKPSGPLLYGQIGLAEDGTLFRFPNGNPWFGVGPPKLDPEPPMEMARYWGWELVYLVYPALLTISFLHCKNVKIKTRTPPKKLKLKHRKKKGSDLARYHVLDIEPIQRVLEKYQTGSRDDLRRALHICRGHFKTFTPDAPLFGRHTGTYWWAPHVKGAKDAGVVLKDYRVHAPSEFGRTYRDADENPPDATREAPPSTKNPDSLGRGLAAHNKTQNKISEIVTNLGWVPLSPAPEEPDYDLAWKVGEDFFVCEVKSLTPENEERQLRLGLGQVIRYKQKLAAAGHEPITPVIASEREPEDASWIDLCEQENILLVWPEVAEKKFSEEIKVIESAMNCPS
jgi:hypothetical protein